jgi:hypothetical protein
MTERRRWVRRIVTRAIVLLLLGAIINVAVAWGCHFWTPVHISLTGNMTASNQGVSGAFQFEAEAIGLMISGTSSAIPEAVGFVNAGLPLYSLWGTFNPEDAKLLGIPATMMVATDRSRFIPFKPLWPGFAINTLFYAAILWGVFVAPFALRRRQRIKRGLCPKCAYPVGGSDVCTECGTSLLQISRSDLR